MVCPGGAHAASKQEYSKSSMVFSTNASGLDLLHTDSENIDGNGTNNCIGNSSGSS